MARSALRRLSVRVATAVLAIAAAVSVGARYTRSAVPVGTTSPVGPPRLLAAAESVVFSPDRPVYGDDSVRLTRLWRTTGPEWRGPRQLTLSQQRVFVLDTAAHAIYSVWRTGAPAERVDVQMHFAAPLAIAYSDGFLAVADSARKAVFVLNASGDSVTWFRGGLQPAVIAAGQGRFGVSGNSVDDLYWSIRTLQDGGERSGEATALAGPPVDSDLVFCRVSGGAVLVATSCDRPVFEVLDPAGEGRVLRRIGVRRAPTPALSDRGGHRVPSVLGARYDASGRRFALWSRPPRGDGWLELFSGEGVYLARIRIPGDWIDFAFDAGTIFALERRSGGGPARLAAYTLHLPGDAPVPAAHPPPPAKEGAP